MKNDNGKLNFFNIIVAILIICIIALVISQYNTFNKKPIEEVPNKPIDNSVQNIEVKNEVVEDTTPPTSPEELNNIVKEHDETTQRKYFGEYFLSETKDQSKSISLVLKDNNNCTFNLEYNTFLIGKYEIKDNKVITKFTNMDSNFKGTVQKTNLNATFEFIDPSTLKLVSVENNSKKIIKDETLKNILEKDLTYKVPQNDYSSKIKYDTYKLDNPSNNKGTYTSCTIDIKGQNELSINFNDKDSISAKYNIQDKQLIADAYFTYRVKDKSSLTNNSNIELIFDIINMDTIKLHSIKVVNPGVFNENDFKGILEKDLTYSVKQASIKK